MDSLRCPTHGHVLPCPLCGLGARRNETNRTQMRYELAKAAMQGLMSVETVREGPGLETYLDANQRAWRAVEHADALLQELEKEPK